MIKITECKVSSLFAYLSLIYISGSIYYMIITRSFGTPFNNALQHYPELVQIKKDAVNKRKKVFYTGIIISTIVLLIIRPFGKCWN